ncbi:MAG: LacI family DNA-binding transcriptional regulator [Pseudomonadota bacterium]
MGKPTLSTVAEAVGVSVPTVSQVMRGTGRISDKTRERVLQAAERLHYVQDSRAAAMRSGDNREIGFAINQLQNPFNAEVISGVVDRLEAEGYLVSVFDTRDDQDRQARQLETFIKHGRGGLLWVPAVSTGEKTLQMLQAHRVPAVTFLRQSAEAFDHVGIKDIVATETATQHLIELGHTRFAYLGGVDMTSVRRDRMTGFKNGLAAAGKPEGVIWPCADNKLAGLEAMLDLHAKFPEITAIVCNGDMVALGACLALIRLGKTPGKDVSVIGFDDIQDAAVATPPLTTMAVHPQTLGRTLAETLLARINHPDAPATHIDLPAELVVRETTGPQL